MTRPYPFSSRPVITVASMVRDAAGYMPRYLRQIERLRHFVDVRLVVAEGDSRDDTLDLLKAGLASGDTLVEADHGGRWYGSVDHPDRWADIASVFARQAVEFGEVGDAFVWVEADLLWAPAIVLDLVADLRTVPAVAPMVLTADKRRFYDTWGFRKDGERFGSVPPYHHGLTAGLTPIDSCGSMFACRPDVVAEVKEWGGRWPLRLGCSQLHIDPDLVVFHP